jgi:hypothetical protein
VLEPGYHQDVPWPAPSDPRDRMRVSTSYYCTMP